MEKEFLSFSESGFYLPQEEVLEKIQSGKFTKEWMDECKNGQKNFLATRAKLAEHPVEKVGAELRAMMPWIGKKKLVDSDKS